MIFIFIRLIELAVERGREGGWAEAETGFSTIMRTVHRANGTGQMAHKYYLKQEPNCK